MQAAACFTNGRGLACFANLCTPICSRHTHCPGVVRSAFAPGTDKHFGTGDHQLRGAPTRDNHFEAGAQGDTRGGPIWQLWDCGPSTFRLATANLLQDQGCLWLWFVIWQQAIRGNGLELASYQCLFYEYQSHWCLAHLEFLGACRAWHLISQAGSGDPMRTTLFVPLCSDVSAASPLQSPRSLTEPENCSVLMVRSVDHTGQ